MHTTSQPSSDPFEDHAQARMTDHPQSSNEIVAILQLAPGDFDQGLARRIRSAAPCACGLSM
jgi:hypothetical protein